MDKFTTLIEEFTKVISQNGDDPNQAVCYYHPWKKSEFSVFEEEEPNYLELVEALVKALPMKEFTTGFGATPDVTPAICFTKDWIYVQAVYDSAVWVTRVPARPDVLKKQKLIEMPDREERVIPLIGGG